MITNALITLGTILATIITFPFPESAGFPPSFLAAFTDFGSYVGFADLLVPISALGTATGLILTLELSIFGFKGLRWISSHLPFIGGRG